MEEKVKKETIDAKLEELNKLRVTLDTVIPEQKALVNVNGQTVFGRGDLVAVKAKAKQGKTTMLKHMVAAMLKGELPPLNCEVEGCRVLWCDTEQKMSDVKKIIYDIVQISGLSPGFIASHLKLYTFRKLTYQMMVDNTEYLIKSYHPDTVIIDGVVDYIKSFNDEEASHKLINWLVRLCEQYTCTIICVLHENKSSDDSNMRGHLGTMLQQKAEVVLKCSIKEGVITVSSPDARHKAAPEWHLMYDDSGHIISADMPDGTQMTPSMQMEQKRLDVIKDIIRNSGGAIARKPLGLQLEKEFGLSRQRVANIISEFIRKQELTENMGIIRVQEGLFEE